MIDKLNQFHKTRLGYLVFGLVELGLAYVISIWAINNGSLWLWLIAFILLFGCVQNFARMLVVHKK